MEKIQELINAGKIGEASQLLAKTAAEIPRTSNSWKEISNLFDQIEIIKALEGLSTKSPTGRIPSEEPPPDWRYPEREAQRRTANPCLEDLNLLDTPPKTRTPQTDAALAVITLAALGRTGDTKKITDHPKWGELLEGLPSEKRKKLLPLLLADCPSNPKTLLPKEAAALAARLAGKEIWVKRDNKTQKIGVACVWTSGISTPGGEFFSRTEWEIPAKKVEIHRKGTQTRKDEARDAASKIEI